jgi:hypothetical protein
MGMSSTLEALPIGILFVVLLALAVPSATILVWLLLTRKELSDSNKNKYKFD